MRPLLLLCSLAAAVCAQDALFNGKTLDGWVTKGGPYDGNAKWTVEDSAIVGRHGPAGAGGLLYTAGEYRNFEVELETQVSWPFDSGIFLRMRPGAKGAQVTLDYRPGGEVGGIYADGWWLHNPAGAAAFKRDKWNHFRVRCVGSPMHVQVWMNGMPLTDYRFPEAARGFAQKGRIGLQVHGGGPSSKAMFRKITVRPLPDDAGQYFDIAIMGNKVVNKEGRAVGWRHAFTRPPAGSGFEMRRRMLTLLHEGTAPHLATAEDYKDFHLIADFKLGKLANSGIFLRAARDGGNPAYSGCEVQLIDDFNWEAAFGKLKPWQFTGSLYGAVPPRKKAMREGWNSIEILYRGSRLTTTLNGVVLYDVDTHALDAKPPFEERAKAGFIGIQRHAPKGAGEYAWFRSIVIRKLD